MQPGQQVFDFLRVFHAVNELTGSGHESIDANHAPACIHQRPAGIARRDIGRMGHDHQAVFQPLDGADVTPRQHQLRWRAKPALLQFLHALFDLHDRGRIARRHNIQKLISGGRQREWLRARDRFRQPEKCYIQHPWLDRAAARAARHADQLRLHRAAHGARHNENLIGIGLLHNMRVCQHQIARDEKPAAMANPRRPCRGDHHRCMFQQLRE